MKVNLSVINTFLCCLFFSVMLVTPTSYTWGPFGLAVLSLFTLNNTWKSLDNKNIKIICASLLPYFIFVILSFALYGGKASQLDMPSRVLFACIVLLYLYQYPPKPKFIFYSIPIGGILTGLIAIIHIAKSSPRAFTDDGYMVIQVAGMCATLGVLSLISYFYAQEKNEKSLVIISAIGAILANLACLLTGGRGAWVLTPFIIAGLLWNKRKLISKKIAILGSIVVIFCLIAASSQITARLESAATDIADYSQGNTDTSVGIRLELWKSSIYSLIDKPIFGQGFDGTLVAKRKQYAEGKITKTLIDRHFTRAHNQFFEDMQTKGILGVIALISMFYFPFKVFKSVYDDPRTSIESRNFSLMGMCHVVLIIGYSLTQHYLNHHSGIILYTIGTVIFVSLCIPRR